MFRTLFADILNGRVRRLPFLGYSLLLGFLFVAVVLAIAFALGVAERLLAGDLEFARAPDAGKISGIALAVIGAATALFAFAQLNLNAKRVRDMGLPGWLVVIGVAIVSVALSGLWAPEAGGAVNLFIWLALLLIPSDTFA